MALHFILCINSMKHKSEKASFLFIRHEILSFSDERCTKFVTCDPVSWVGQHDQSIH